MKFFKKLTAAALLFGVLASVAHAGIYTLVGQNGNPYRGDVLIQIWDTSMAIHSQFQMSGPRMIIDGPQYPASGPYTMVIFVGNNEVWRGRVSRNDGLGDDNGRIIHIAR